MIETLVLALGLPLIATAITRTTSADVSDALRWRSPPAIVSAPGDDCATVRQYGYAGNVDVARIGDPCGVVPNGTGRERVATTKRP